MKEKTYEGTKKTQNGLKRMFFSVLAILLQAVFMVYMLTRLNEYAAAINTIVQSEHKYDCQDACGRVYCCRIFI